MKSGNKIKQMVLVVSENKRHEGCLIGNSNTGRLHSPECSAIDTMKEDHKIPQTVDNSLPAAGAMNAVEQTAQIQTRTILKTLQKQKSVQIKK